MASVCAMFFVCLLLCHSWVSLSDCVDVCCASGTNDVMARRKLGKFLCLNEIGGAVYHSSDDDDVDGQTGHVAGSRAV